jgi:hypothetical protein
MLYCPHQTGENEMPEESLESKLAKEVVDNMFPQEWFDKLPIEFDSVVPTVADKIDNRKFILELQLQMHIVVNGICESDFFAERETGGFIGE